MTVPGQTFLESFQQLCIRSAHCLCITPSYCQCLCISLFHCLLCLAYSFKRQSHDTISLNSASPAQLSCPSVSSTAAANCSSFISVQQVTSDYTEHISPSPHLRAHLLSKLNAGKNCLFRLIFLCCRRLFQCVLRWLRVDTVCVDGCLRQLMKSPERRTMTIPTSAGVCWLWTM